MGVHAARFAPHGDRHAGGDGPEPVSDPVDDVSLVVGEFVGSFSLESVAEEHPRGNDQRDPPHEELQVELFVAGDSRELSIDDLVESVEPAREAPPRNAGATRGCVRAQALSDWVKMFSPTPIRTGMRMAGGRDHVSASVTSIVPPKSASVTTKTVERPNRRPATGPSAAASSSQRRRSWLNARSALSSERSMRTTGMSCTAIPLREAKQVLSL